MSPTCDIVKRAADEESFLKTSEPEPKPETEFSSIILCLFNVLHLFCTLWRCPVAFKLNKSRTRIIKFKVVMIMHFPFQTNICGVFYTVEGKAPLPFSPPATFNGLDDSLALLLVLIHISQ